MSPVGPARTTIDPAGLSAAQCYQLLTGVVVPRPIAWVTSTGPDGALNLAPFSAFTMVSNMPPMVGINIGLRDGEPKDTSRNIEARGEYVVNIAGWEHHHAVHESGLPYPPGVDEAHELGLATTASDVVSVPRLVDARVSLECRLSQVVEFGRAGARFTVGEVVRFHVATDALDGFKIDTATLDPLARVAGPTYTRIGSVERLQGVQSVSG
ncbi:flavin reductase family protein [Nocardioides hwasunensis]|uniref:Flavin reductase family protein n=1 Tax=Nocardioides hwasunensis TaxID=397258 RepID=A0ABR8MI00_9ACTN|nr:flavin reductase family protein [Nocardioides hwasunensis]MBD3915602.1 flavin reductase family protein [Nocardioides hwasunensis]